MLNKNIPFYLQIARIIRVGILDGKYIGGGKLPPEEELAVEFGVSKDVIRKSLRLLAEEGLLRRIRRNGTFVSDVSQDRGSRILLLSCHGPIPLEKIRNGIIGGMGSKRLELTLQMIHPIDTSVERKYLKTINPGEYAAIIAAPAIGLDNSDNRELYAKFIQSGIPVIALDHEFTDIPADCICFDEYESVRRVANEVASRPTSGKTVFFCTDAQHRILSARAKALKDVCDGLGGENDNRCFIKIPQTNLNNKKLIEEFIQALLERDFRPNTIVITHNLLGYHLYQQLRKMGWHTSVKCVGTIGLPGVGDSEFDAVTTCHYRIFDEFSEYIKDILHTRLYYPESIGTTICRKILCKPMTSSEARMYLASAFSTTEETV